MLFLVWGKHSGQSIPERRQFSFYGFPSRKNRKFYAWAGGQFYECIKNTADGESDTPADER